jgi:hypothetical protein
MLWIAVPYRKLFFIGGGGLKARVEGPRKFFNLESLKCHFLDFEGRFDRILMVRKQRFRCQNLQFSSTKWAKAYLINYILDKLQFVMDNVAA